MPDEQVSVLDMQEYGYLYDGTVSYTHLDVYKRQGEIDEFVEKELLLDAAETMNALSEAEKTAVSPVSYTHLDVYKRQPPRPKARPHRRKCSFWNCWQMESVCRAQSWKRQSMSVGFPHAP